tara:strand:- start:1818 stop:2075 length:258 start_codon:yes stop_codon:yes gene_type:complete
MARSNIMDYITISSTSSASDFGDLLATVTSGGGTDNNSRGMFSGGYDGDASDVIQYFSVDTTGDSADFGNLTLARSDLGSLSGNA